MYISDYGFSTVSDYWQYIFAEYDEYLVRNNNWRWLGSSESTITRISDLDSSQLIFIIDYGGSLSYFGNPDSNYAIRPCFYLVSSTQYISGSGTSSDPIRIN